MRGKSALEDEDEFTRQLRNGPRSYSRASHLNRLVATQFHYPFSSGAPNGKQQEHTRRVYSLSDPFCRPRKGTVMLTFCLSVKGVDMKGTDFKQVLTSGVQ